MTAFRIDGAGDLADALRAAATAAGWSEGSGSATFVVPPIAENFNAIVERIARARAARPGALVVVLDPAISDLTRAAFAGALGQLAIAAAPTARIAAVVPAPDADPADAAAAALFLAEAGSTTGQLLTVEPVRA